MATTILRRDLTDEISLNMSKRFIPKLKTGEETNYFSLNAGGIDSHIYENSFQNENNAFNQITYLFPSIPKEVRKY